MKKASLIVSCLILMATTLWASNALSARSKLLLAHRAGHTRTLNASAGNSFKAFIAVSGVDAVDSLCMIGVRVLGEYDGFIAAEIPADCLQGVMSSGVVRQVSLAQTLHLCNDSARCLSNVLPVHHGNGLPSALLGDGAIVGLIDTGIDFNHINFLDADGRSRIRAVYLPEDSTGISPVVNGRVLPGSCYETPEQIASMTADCFNSSHGSHTAGTAAGGAVCTAKGDFWLSRRTLRRGRPGGCDGA